MRDIMELQEEYSRNAYLIWWKTEEIQTYTKNFVSEKEVQDWAIGKMLAGIEFIQELQKKKAELLKTDLGQVLKAKQEELKKFELIEKEVNTCLICRAFRSELHPVFCLANQVYFWIVEFGELSFNPQPDTLRKRMKTLSVKQRQALQRVQEYGHSCKLTKALLKALDNY